MEIQTINPQVENEFAYVDAIISAHTNSAIAKVNAEALQTYWEVGQFVSNHLRSSEWGDHVVGELADYLQRKNPQRKGYGKRNLYNMVKFYDAYSTDELTKISDQLQLSEFVQLQTAQIKAHPIVQMASAQNENEIVQMASAQFKCVPLPDILYLTNFSNHLEILNRCHSMEEYIFYILYAAHEHLKVEELRRSIVNQTYSSIMSKDKQMSPALLEQYPDATFLLKDRVFIDFLGLPSKFDEPKLHSALLDNMKQFVLELGKDFIYMASEFTVMVGNKPKRIDLLFYHRSLQCLVAVELKAVDFESEFVSKMDMYLEALDRDHKRPNENPSMGIILCPSADRAEVEYSINRTMSPTMVAEYNRLLVPREVATQSLAEYCAYLKQTYK